MNPADYIVNLKRSGPDVRDLVWHKPDHIAVPMLPAVVDNQPDYGPVFDQGAEGSCSSNSYAASFEAMQRVDNLVQFTPPSRRFSYDVGRILEGTFPNDSGCSIRDIVAAGVKYGICSELEMPYIAGQLSLAPTVKQYADALPNRPSAYRSVAQDLATIQACIAVRKPILFGFGVYTGGFDATGADGLIPSPSGSLRGYHANVLCGYSDVDQRLKTRNSWGTGWGRSGYGFFKYSDILNPNFAFDFWTIDSVVGPNPLPLVPLTLSSVTPPATFQAQWNAAGGNTDHYNLYFSESPSMTDPVFRTTTSLSYPGDYPLDHKTRFMQVVAMDASNRELERSNVVPYGY